MYGKLFASTFTGSMMGAGAETFAVWGYAIANADRKGFVELNAKLLAAVIGSTPQAMTSAIETLAAPDPDSRTKDEEGRRIIREGTFFYRIVNYEKHRGMRDEDARRESQRTLMRDKRAKSLDPVSRREPPLAHAEAEVEAKEKADTDPEAPLPPSKNGTSKLWTAIEWRRRFDRAWSEAYNTMATPGGGESAARATADLGDQLIGLPLEATVDAQARAGAMFAEYLGDTKPDVLKARHPWSWFVTRFRGLLVPAKSPAAGPNGKATVVPGWTDSEYPE